jgi:hypothetical protein
MIIEKCDQMIGKICPIYGNSSQSSCQIKNKKCPIMFHFKANLKVQNICIKPLLKPKNAYNKPYLEIAYLGENV